MGFTEQEVRGLCADSSMAFEKIQEWYDGYIMGDGIHIYNPKSVMEAIRRKRIRSYWTRTETYEWNKTADAAIQQIRDRDYPHALRDYGGDLLVVGVNYDEKTKKHTCE